MPIKEVGKQSKDVVKGSKGSPRKGQKFKVKK